MYLDKTYWSWWHLLYLLKYNMALHARWSPSHPPVSRKIFGHNALNHIFHDEVWSSSFHTYKCILCSAPLFFISLCRENWSVEFELHINYSSVRPSGNKTICDKFLGGIDNTEFYWITGYIKSNFTILESCNCVLQSKRVGDGKNRYVWTYGVLASVASA